MSMNWINYVLLIIFTIYACSGPFTTIRSVKKLKLEHVVGDDKGKEVNKNTKSDKALDETTKNNSDDA